MPHSRQSCVILLIPLLALLSVGIVISTGHSSPSPPIERSELDLPIDLNELEVIDVPVDALSVSATFESPVSEVEIPAFAQKLAGRRVRLRGMMYPSFRATGLTEYDFIPETREKSYHIRSTNFPLHGLIFVMTSPGHTEKYTHHPITIEGTFEVKIDEEEGTVYGIYQIRGAKIVEQNTELRGHLVLDFGC